MSTLILENSVGLQERRLTRRVQKTWRSCADGCLPSWDDIKKLNLGEDWRSCFAVDLTLSTTEPYFVFVGETLGRLADYYLSGPGKSDTALIDLAAAKMDEAALTRAPVSYGDQIRLSDGRKIVLRSVILPLSDNGDDVTHVFGAANGKGA